MMKKDILRQWVNVLAVIAVIVINGLANALPLNGLTTGEISDRFQVYFVPAGYVFSIWGLIYVALIAFAVYQALPAQRDNPRLRRIGYLFALSCVANIAWLFLWHYEIFPLALVAMVALLLLLIAIYLRLDIGRAQVPAAEKWLAHVPFSIYLGWITVATIANVTSLLDYLNWNGWGISPEAWTLIMLVVGVGIASAVSLTRGDVAYMLVIVWAFAGIAVKHAGTPVVATAAWVTTALVALMLVVGLVFRKRSRYQHVNRSGDPEQAIKLEEAQAAKRAARKS
jgi:benzodiazapine receptor